jgi:hypothetical protein
LKRRCKLNKDGTEREEEKKAMNLYSAVTSQRTKLKKKVKLSRYTPRRHMGGEEG